MRKIIAFTLLAINCMAVHALPDWMPGKDAIEKHQLESWNKENSSLYKLDLQGMKVINEEYSRELSGLSFTGYVQNSTSENIDSWIVELRAIDKRTKTVVLVTKTRLHWPAPRTLNRRFDNIKFRMYFGQSQYQKIATSLGANFEWNGRLINAIPQKYKDYQVDNIFKIESGDNFFSNE